MDYAEQTKREKKILDELMEVLERNKCIMSEAIVLANQLQEKLDCLTNNVSVSELNARRKKEEEDAKRRREQERRPMATYCW